MRIAQAVSWYLPESSGGCEVYVDGLARRLQARGHAVEVGVPAPNPGRATVRGVPVRRYPVPTEPTPAEQGESRPPRTHAGFREWLAGGFDLYHQHGLRYGCGIWQLEAARVLGLPTVLTLHMPEALCPRKTMMWQGREACARPVTVGGCGACLGDRQEWLWLAAATPLGHTPARFLAPLGRLGGPGAALAAAAARVKEIRRFRRRLRRALALADRVVVVSHWLREALAANGAGPGRVRLVRYGVEGAPPATAGAPREGPLRLVYLGRWDPVKGVQVLVEAFRHLAPSVPVTLDLYAMAASAADRDNRDRLLPRIEADPRIRVREPVPHDRVVETLAGYDTLVVPSQWMETGPLVVLEAFAAGLPVIGSDLGGIREWVVDGGNGLLVRHDRPQAWAEAIGRLAAGGQRDALRSGIGPVRTMEQVTDEMLELYQALVAAPPP